ncbi:hypothetical phage protein [Citrobacter phage CR8]|uniref:Hypothetical phage protein n=1 Tax=Citrobacter phage CR8 TaxID=1455076 RepID=W6PUN3_9CAUD|nr:hypothetical protein CF79_gp09 [Citrobacter phage CR8]CDM21593.1 hypothetical phage protein [Citrobacter phage CR8]
MTKVIRIDGTCAGVQYFTARIQRSSREEQYQNDRERVLMARMRAEGNKAELYGYMFGSLRPKSEDGKLLLAGLKAGIQKSEDGKLLLAGLKAGIQKSRIKHTTKGDFTHLHSGRNELR